MYRRIVIIIIFFIIIQASNNIIYANDDIKILLVFNGRVEYGQIKDEVIVFKELLGRFSENIDEISQDRYEKGLSNKYDYVIYLGIQNNDINDNLIDDLLSYEGKIIWIGNNIKKFLSNNEKLTLKFSDRVYDFKSITYKNKKFLLGVNREYNILDYDSQNVNIYGYLSDGKEEYPYILEESNFIYISRYESYGILFYVLCDALQDVFNLNNELNNSVFIRIEDVHPFRDVEKLISIGEYLHSKNIPFMIALIPAYVSPKDGQITSISQMNQFKETIKYLQDIGGSIVLHGYTHQAFGGEKTGEGYEFWDGISDKPLDIDIEKWANERVGNGIKECLSNDIYPLAFEAPHYAISQDGFKEIKKYFSTYIGQVQTSDLGFVTTTYPYEIYNTDLFNRLIPENLGYIDENDPLSVERMFENYREISIVRGNVAGLFFHPYIDITYLKEIVERLDNDTNFIDLKQQNNWVEWNDIKITSQNGKIYTNFKKENIGRNNDFGYYFFNISNIIAIIIGFFCLVLAIIFVYSRKNSKKKLIR